MKKLLFITAFASILLLATSCHQGPILGPSTQLSTANPIVLEQPFMVNYVLRITNVDKTSKLLNDVCIVALDSNNNPVTLGQRYFNLQVYTGNIFEGTIHVPTGLHNIHFVSGAWMTDTANWTICPYHNSTINSAELRAYKNGILFTDLSLHGIDSLYWSYGHWDVSTNKVLSY